MDAAGAQPERPQQGGSWMGTILRIVIFQAVLRFFSPSRPTPKDPLTNLPYPQLHNAFIPNGKFDLFSYITPTFFSDWDSLNGPDSNATLIWSLGDLDYSLKTPTHSTQLTFHLDGSLGQTILHQNRQNDMTDAELDLLYQDAVEKRALPSKSDAEDDEDAVDEEANEKREFPSTESSRKRGSKALSSSWAMLADKLTQSREARKAAWRAQNWQNYYLVALAVPHSAYEHRNAKFLAQSKVSSNMYSHIAVGKQPLVEFMKPFAPDELVSLVELARKGDDELRQSDAERKRDEETGKRMDEPHWKTKLDIRLVYETSAFNLASINAPHLRPYMKVDEAQDVYTPPLHPIDIWLLEKEYFHLNETSIDAALPLQLSFRVLRPLYWMAQTQLNDLWNSKDRSANPMAMLSNQGRREQFMLKRIILDTNPYFLAFSACFMLLHSLFSFLAFKNDIQFWRGNDSMEGLSALSVIASFIAQLVIGLYLFDTEETSSLILFEIFLGVALSAWKVTKAVKISFKPTFPFMTIQDAKGYGESETKKYDIVAIKFMSLLLLPCVLGYAIYAVFYQKFKSWYSYTLAVLAGTVYTFGFIMMTPQLYVNYKLKSVDHLPWRALIYKSLNTFVDDIAAFIIDMPWMHRLSCFRDDIIFICYLYQRWAYRVDKTRTAEWGGAVATDSGTASAAVTGERAGGMEPDEREREDSMLGTKEEEKEGGEKAETARSDLPSFSEEAAVPTDGDTTDEPKEQVLTDSAPESGGAEIRQRRG